MTDTRPHPTPPRSMQPHAGAPEESTWSTRSAASMNDVDTDKHRHTMGNEEGPDHRHNAAESAHSCRCEALRTLRSQSRPRASGAERPPSVLARAQRMHVEWVVWLGVALACVGF